MDQLRELFLLEQRDCVFSPTCSLHFAQGLAQRCPFHDRLAARLLGLGSPSNCQLHPEYFFKMK